MLLSGCDRWETSIPTTAWHNRMGSPSPSPLINNSNNQIHVVRLHEGVMWQLWIVETSANVYFYRAFFLFFKCHWYFRYKPFYFFIKFLIVVIVSFCLDLWHNFINLHLPIFLFFAFLSAIVNTTTFKNEWDIPYMRRFALAIYGYLWSVTRQ